MHWILLTICSAIVLGIYGLAKKAAVDNNAVPPVLVLNVTTAAIIYLPIMIVSSQKPEWLVGTRFLVESLSTDQHALVFAKAVLVAASWILAFYALKNLPLSIAAPIRSTSPLWTILIASTVFAERPSPIQWLGIGVILAAFFAFSRIGRKEGIRFGNNRWVVMMIAATLLGATSALYDKYLLQQIGLHPATLQAWFSAYLVIAMVPLAIHWYLKDRRSKPFQFRWSIPTIAVTLLIADFFYFLAISDSTALIAVISPIRRTSVVIPFLYGVFFLGEENRRSKAICIAVMLGGVYLVSWQST